MTTQVATGKIALPSEGEWVLVNVREREGKLADGTYVETGGYTIRVARRYPVYEGGLPVTNLKHRDMPQFFREQNNAYGLSGSEAIRWPYGFEDESVRDELGPEHDMFDENFSRMGAQRAWGYFGDFTMPSRDSQLIEGITQQLVQRVYYLRTLGGDMRVGLVTAAPGGMVPRFTKDQLERIIRLQGLKKLEELRGYEIHESGNQVVDVRNPLGVVQLTFPHDFQYKGRLAPHSHHVYSPSQYQNESVGIRNAVWRLHHDELGCFYVDLDANAGLSDSGRSVPLVRGEARIKIGRSFL